MKIFVEDSAESNDSLEVTIKTALTNAARILEIPVTEEAWKNESTPSAKSDELRILLTKTVPTLEPSSETFLICELLSEQPREASGGYKICSAVTLIFSLVKTARNPKFRNISQEVAKPLIKAVQNIAVNPALNLKTFARGLEASFVRGKNDEKTCLLLLDIQPRVFNAFPFKCDWLIDNILEIIPFAKSKKWDIVITEQVPDKLGGTDERIVKAAGDQVEVHGKSDFSAASFLTRFDHVVILGIESHICVALTALELAHDQKKVTIITDAVGSSCPMSDWSLVPRLTGGSPCMVQFVDKAALLSM